MNPSNQGNNWPKKGVLDILYQSDVKLTPVVLVKEIRDRFKCSSRAAKKIVSRLIADQELCYHQMYGATYIEKSFLRPVKVTGRFILSPSGFKPSENDTCHTIVVEPGISFGSGQHPTTRLCLEAIDRCFYKGRQIDKPGITVGADVGTGSGVLAMAMVKAGLGSCNAYEIDPVSVNEAKKNVRANNLEKQIDVIADLMPSCPDGFGMICANLRCPTLKQLAPLFEQNLKSSGVLILSGLREWEKADLIGHYRKLGFNCIWQKDEKQWSGLMLVKFPTPSLQ